MQNFKINLNSISFALLAFFATGLASPLASARLLSWGSSSWNQARLVSSGDQRVSFKVQAYKTSTSYGSNSQPTDSGKAYGFTTTFADLIEKSGDRGAEIKTLLKDQGVNESTPVYSTEFSLETNEVQSELTWTRGLTDWWMVGISLPYIQSTTKIKSSQKLSPEFQEFKKNLEKTKGSTQPIDSFVNDQKSGSTDLELEANDYDELNGTVEYSGVGDVELLSQLKLLESGRLYGALRQRLVVPTGNNEGPYTYIKSNSADGQVDLGLDALVDFQATRAWMLTGLLGYTVQVEDTQAARVPRGSGSQMQWRVDENVKRDLGDVFIARVNSVFQFFEQYWMTAGLEMTQKSKDQYSGSEFEEWRYDLMENNTDESRKLARMGLRYTSRSWRYSYLSKSHFSAGLEYLTVFAGKNTPKADATALELSVSY